MSDLLSLLREHDLPADGVRGLRRVWDMDTDEWFTLDDTDYGNEGSR